MSKFLRMALLAALGVLVCASVASAVVPDPTFSVIGNCMVLAPGGEYPFQVVVKDQFNNPINNSTVTVDFSACTGAKICSSQDAGFTSTATTVTGHTDPTGTVTFTIHGGNPCSGTIKVIADGVQIGSLSQASSPDLTGDFLVDVADLGAFAGDQVTQFFGADLTCDGLVDVADLGAFASSQAFHGGDPHCP